MEAQLAAKPFITPDGGDLARFADRWIWVFITGMYLLVVLVGFIPDSLRVLAAAEAGQRPPLPPILHLHAVAMGAWLLLLLAQSTLMATGRKDLHFKLGLVSLALVPVMLVGMIGIVTSTFGMLATIPPGVMPTEVLNETKVLVSNLVLEQSRVVVLFTVFVIWALLIRRKDSEMHKRLLILATLLPLPAAYDRITWIPTTMPSSPLSMDLYMLLLMVPLVAYDLSRLGRIHKAVVIFVTANIPFMVFAYLNWGTDWWLSTAPRLFGIESW
jgi:hypothetical protein